MHRKLVPSAHQFHRLLRAVTEFHVQESSQLPRDVPRPTPKMIEHTETLSVLVNTYYTNQSVLASTSISTFYRRMYETVIDTFLAMHATSTALLWYQRMIDARLYPDTKLLYFLIRALTSASSPDPVTACRLYDTWFVLRTASSWTDNPDAALQATSIYNRILSMYRRSYRVADILTFYNEMRRTRTAPTTHTLRHCIGPFLDSERASAASATASGKRASDLPGITAAASNTSSVDTPAMALQRDAHLLFEFMLSLGPNARDNDGPITPKRSIYLRADERLLTRAEIRGLDLFMLRVQNAIKEQRAASTAAGNVPFTARSAGASIYTPLQYIISVLECCLPMLETHTAPLFPII
jgi:hypothetical protein